MSWSISACGPVTKVMAQLEDQFSRIKMNDPGEQETIQSARTLISNTLATYGQDRVVNVSASGSMGFRDWSIKSDPYQSVDLKIAPIHFTTL